MTAQEMAEARLSVLWQLQQLALDNIENAHEDADRKAWEAELARINRRIQKARN